MAGTGSCSLPSSLSPPRAGPRAAGPLVTLPLGTGWGHVPGAGAEWGRGGYSAVGMGMPLARAGRRGEKPGENGQVPAGMGTAKSLVWRHHITRCQQLGDVNEAFGAVQWGARGLGEGTGLQVGEVGWIWGLCWKLYPQQEPCISPRSALTAPSPVHPLRVLNITQPWERTPQLGCTSPQGPSHITAPRDPSSGHGGALQFPAPRGAISWCREHRSAGGLGPVGAALAWFTQTPPCNVEQGHEAPTW